MGVLVGFANGKGGVGKTSLACSYSVEVAKAGRSVMIVDLDDEQHSAVTWARTRKQNGYKPEVMAEIVTARRLPEMIGRYDVLVADTPGWTDRSTIELARLATFLVIPCGPHETFDLEPTVRLLHGLTLEKIAAARFGVALTRLHPNTAEAEEMIARAYLKGAEPGYEALPGFIRDLPTYATALQEGRGLTETGRGHLNEQGFELLNAITGRVVRSARQERGADRGRTPERARSR